MVYTNCYSESGLGHEWFSGLVFPHYTQKGGGSTQGLHKWDHIDWSQLFSCVPDDLVQHVMRLCKVAHLQLGEIHFNELKPPVFFCLNPKHMRTCLSTQQRAASSHISIIFAKRFEKCQLTCSRTSFTVCAMHKGYSWQFFLGCSEKTVFNILYNEW